MASGPRQALVWIALAVTAWQASAIINISTLASYADNSVIPSTSTVADSDWQITAESKDEAQIKSKKYAEVLKTRTPGGKGPRNPDAERWWSDFKGKYGKRYKNADDEDNAKEAFLDNLDFISKFNEDDTKPFWVGPNQYSDMPPAAFKSQVLMSVNPALSRLRVAAAGSQLPNRKSMRRMLGEGDSSAIDWRSRGKVSGVRNQGLCGSCWAFAASSAMEAAYNIALYKTAGNSDAPVLSPQQLLDCENARSGWYSLGCLGGYSDGAMEYAFRVNHTLDSRYPYRGVLQSACNVAATTSKAIKLGGTSPVVYPTQNSTWALMQQVDRQPVITYLDASRAFAAYAGGVFTPSATDCSLMVNHAVLIVGYVWKGDYPGSYWIIQNSWGTSWGESGYIRIAMQPPGPGACGMYMYPMAPSMQFAKSL